MTNERYAKMIKYKSALDNCWKKKDRLNIYDDDYERTLGEAKVAGFKVYRNSNGEHKLIDNVKSEGEAKIRDMFVNAMRSR